MSECRASDAGRSRGQTMSLRLEVGVDNEQITTSLSPDTRGSVTDVLSVVCLLLLGLTLLSGPPTQTVNLRHGPSVGYNLRSLGNARNAHSTCSYNPFPTVEIDR